MNSLAELETKLKEAREHVRHLTVMALRDNLTPKERAAIREAERSARAEVKLRRKALQHAQAQQA